MSVMDRMVAERANLDEMVYVECQLNCDEYVIEMMI
jgi:hypothetical protein